MGRGRRIRDLQYTTEVWSRSREERRLFYLREFLSGVGELEWESGEAFGKELS